MNTDAKVTIITPTYRRDPAIVRRCLDCVALQTEPRWYHLLIQDGGAPDPALAAMCAADPRREYVVSPRHYGDYANTLRAVALAAVTTPYVCFVDDDNLILPEYVDEMITYLAPWPDKGFAVCEIVHFGPLPGARQPAVLTGNPIKTGNIDTLQVLARTPIMQQCGWQRAGGYCADGATFEKLATIAKPVYVAQVLGFHM